jgi:hypothetical protein
MDKLALVRCALMVWFAALEAVLAASSVISGENSHHLEHARGLATAERIEQALSGDCAQVRLNPH